MFGRLSASIRAVAAALVLAAMAVSCQPDPQDPGQGGSGLVVTENALTLANPVVAAKEGSQYLTVEATGNWTLTIDYADLASEEDLPEEWVSLSAKEGKAGSKKVVLGWTRNYDEDQRSCKIVLSVGRDDVVLEFTQRGVKQNNHVAGLHSDPVPGWLELPATDDPNLYFFTHDMQHGGVTKRNYSFYLDPQACLAIWVAYPLNNNLAGSGSRTDKWALDPKVPREFQPVIFSGFKGGYDRGHQLPSADRLTSGANEQTFYGTNMTPQKGELNQKAWASLEGKVRTWSNQFDTLYVVTGCDLNGYRDYAYDNDGKAIPVPVGYFKALLGFKKSGTIGNSTKQGGYTAIAFYFNHEYYADSEIMGQSMTIDDLEDQMGIDFFPNLEARVGKDLYTKIESTPDSWWK
jgi:endonuclease G